MGSISDQYFWNCCLASGIASHSFSQSCSDAWSRDGSSKPTCSKSTRRTQSSSYRLRDPSTMFVCSCSAQVRVNIASGCGHLFELCSHHSTLSGWIWRDGAFLLAWEGVSTLRNVSYKCFRRMRRARAVTGIDQPLGCPTTSHQRFSDFAAPFLLRRQTRTQCSLAQHQRYRLRMSPRSLVCLSSPSRKSCKKSRACRPRW